MTKRPNNQEARRPNYFIHKLCLKYRADKNLRLNYMQSTLEILGTLYYTNIRQVYIKDTLYSVFW